MSEFADKLVERRADLARLMKDWKVVEDVLAGGSDLKNATYLPKHQQEHDDEYKRRLLITPVFPETPKSMQMLLGALFRVEPSVKLPPNLDYLTKQATLASVNSNGSCSLKDCFAKVAEIFVSQGFCGILADRKPLPADVAAKNGVTSEADAKARGLGNVYFAIYPGSQILDFGVDDRGLSWVKLIETYKQQSTFFSKPQIVHIIRVVDRANITKFTVVEDDKGERTVIDTTYAKHDAKDSEKNACVPFRFFNPFAAKDGIGRPILKASAEADAAALWVLSETLWLAYLMAPLLTLKTHRDPKDIGDMGIGASRFITLKAKEGEEEGEALEYTQLDPTAITQLRSIWEMLVDKARDAMAKGGSAVNGPVEQSGISKAWTFKTNEERLLFLMGICLRDGWQWLLELADRMTHGNQNDASVVSVQMPESYDITSPKDTFETATIAADWFSKYKFNAAVKEAMKLALKAMFPNVDEETQDSFDARLEELMEENLRPGLIFENPPEGDEEDEDEDDNKDEEKTGKKKEPVEQK